MWLPFRKKALTPAPAVLDGINTGWTAFPVLGGGSRQRIQEAFNVAQSASYAWMYRKSPAVRTVIDVIAMNVGQLDLRLYEEISDAEREPRPDHPAALSLRYPSETVTQDEFVRQMFTDKLIYNNAYALMMPAAGNQISLFWLPAHMVEIMGSSLFAPDAYRVRRIDGSAVEYPPANILHWRGENPEDPRLGLSKLETLRDVVAEDAALQQAVVELANSGLSQPMYGYRPLEAPPLSPKAATGLSEDLGNQLKSINRRPPILQEGTELRPYGVNPRDAEMMESRKWALERVASMFGVPLGMVGLDDNLEEARDLFYTDTVPPYCEDFTKTLNLRVLVRVYDWTDGCYEFNLDEKQMGNERIKTLVSATGRPVMLTNEGRAKLNLPAVEGGDELVTPANVIVGENPKPSVDIMPVQDPNKPPQDGSYRTDDGKTFSKAAIADLIPVGSQLINESERLPQLHPGRKGDLDRQFRNIDLAKAEMERHYARIERKVFGNGTRTKAAENLPWDRWDREFGDDLTRLVEMVVEKEGGIYAFKLGGGNFDMTMRTCICIR